MVRNYLNEKQNQEKTFFFSLLFSYADYTRVPVNNFNYHIIQNTCAK